MTSVNPLARLCYVHIGTHKTGTTSIQGFLASNRERFAAHGVCLPIAGTERDSGVATHRELARELRGDPAFEPAAGGLAAVCDELARSDARAACLTCEDFTFLYDAPAALTRLRDGIRAAGFEPRIVVYLRAQASYCTAVYAENVRHGYRVPFERYFSDVLERGCYVWDGGTGPPFDYNVLLDGFARVFGRDAIVARRYRSAAADNELLFSFARLLLPPGVDLRAFAVPPGRYNGSLTFGDVLRHLGRGGEASAVPIRFTPLGISQSLRLARRFWGPNARLAARYGVVVPVLEPLDAALALPLRRSPSKMRALLRARRALSGTGKPS